MTRIAYAVGLTEDVDRAAERFSLWAMSFGTRNVEHNPAEDSWQRLEGFAAKRAERTRLGHNEGGALTVFVWRGTTADTYGACTLPADAARFDFPAAPPPRPFDMARGSAPVGFHERRS